MKPPVVARIIVRLLSDPEDRAFLVEDLADRFQEMAETRGLRAARQWYWSQAFSVVPWTIRVEGDWIQWRSWAGVVADLRSGLRTLRRSPLYAIGVSGTLGLGLAAALLVFAVAWRVWLAPMPYPDPDRVVRLYELERPDGVSDPSRAATESRRHQLSAALLEDFRAHSWRTLDAVSAVFTGLQTEWGRAGATRSVTRVRLSPDGFGILGIVPMLGRLPIENETEVLLSEAFWRTNLGGDPDVVGSEIIRGERALLIVGVAHVPAGFPGDADVLDVIEWEDTGDDEDWRSLRYIDAIARVRPGHSVAEAKAELNAFVAALAEIHPQHRGWGVDVVVLADDLMRPFRGALALLLAAGTTFLLLASVNVLGLVAARRIEGRQDRSIRLALGASWGRLLRGSLLESLVLAGIGSLAGVLGAYWLIGPIRAMVPRDVPRLAQVSVTPPLVLGGLSVGVVLGLAIGVSGYLVSRGAGPAVGRAPAWRAVGVGGRRALVVGQVALTALLTAGGAAILHRVSTLKAIELGFDPVRVSTTTMVLSPDRYPSRQSWLMAWHEVLDGLHARGIPAAVVGNAPMSGEDVPPIGVRADAASEEVFHEFHSVSADYFSVMGIAVHAGRVFGATDHASSMPVAIVSEAFVDQFFPVGTPIEKVVGRIIPIGPFMSSRTVVGVVESTRHEGPGAPVMPDVYVPVSQWTFSPRTLVIGGEPGQVAESVSDVVAEVDSDLRWTPVLPYTSHLKEWFAPLRLQLLMIGVLGALGLVLATLGLYALMAYQVATRRKELGIRKAVGATDGSLVWGVLTSGLIMAVLGALVGLGAWYQLLPWTREFVEGIDSAGYLVPLSVAIVVGGSSVLATLVPAVRAARIDPAVTLKAD